MSKLSDTSITVAMHESLKCTSTEQFQVILPLLLGKKMLQEEEMFYKVVTRGCEGHVAIVLKNLKLPDDILYKGIKQSILQKRTGNGRKIIQITKLLLPEELFVEWCETEDSTFVREVVNLFGKTQILHDSLQEGLLRTIGNKDVGVLHFILEEFERPWVKENFLQEVLIEASRCENCSREKLSMIIDKCGEESVCLDTRKKCLFESIRVGNTDTSLYILETIEEDAFDSELTVKVLKLSVERNNVIVVRILSERTSFHELGDKESQDLILLAFETDEEQIIEHLVASVCREKISDESIENMFLKTIEHRNGTTLSLLLRAYGTQSISTEIVLHGLMCSITSNISDIPKILISEFTPTVPTKVLQSAFSSALCHRNIANIELLLDRFGPNLISDNQFQSLLEVAKKDLSIIRVLISRFDISRISCETFMVFANLAVTEEDVDTFRLLLDNSVWETLRKDVDGLFLSTVKGGNVEMIETLLIVVGKDGIQPHSVQEAFLIASCIEDGKALEYLIDDNVFGTGIILEDTLKEAFLMAVHEEKIKTLEIIIARFKRIPAKLKTEGMHSAMDSKSGEVVAEIAKSPSDEWFVDEAFSEAVKYFADKGKKDFVEMFMRVRETCNEAKDKVVGKAKTLFKNVN